jgi:hypothetical protein
MAAMVQQDMGVSRHILEQRVVAGLHMVPFGEGTLRFAKTGVEPEPSSSVEASRERETQAFPAAAQSFHNPYAGELSWDFDPLMLIAEMPE